MRIVHAASEFAPWVRVGHLAGAVGGLSRELARLGHEVAVFLPGYRQVLADPRAVHAQSVFKHTLELGDQMVTAETLRLELASNLTLYLVRRDESFDRTFPYGPPVGVSEVRKVGTQVKQGEPLMMIHYNDESKLEPALEYLHSAYRLAPKRPTPPALVVERVA